jgi:hypothetical protein
MYLYYSWQIWPIQGHITTLPAIGIVGHAESSIIGFVLYLKTHGGQLRGY